MRNKELQISLFDTYNNVLNLMEENKPEIIELIEEYIDFEAIIPFQFHMHYYRHKGRKRINPLSSFIKAFVLKLLLGLKEDKQLLTLLKFAPELYKFCGFEKFPEASKLTNFKKDFADDMKSLFEKLVDITAPICKEIDAKKSEYLIYDTTGFEPYVAENNPKFFNTRLKSAKEISKSNPDFDAYKGVYSMFPDEAKSAPEAKHQYINGQYCYAFKVGIITDGLGIPRHISVFDNDFKANHPETVSKKTNDPDKDKEIGDSKSLKPVLSDFFKKHPNLSFSTFLGDSSFDSYDNYSMLKNDFGFSRICVPLNTRNSKKSSGSFNHFGNPVCPNDGTQFICLGKSGGINRSQRIKWVCPKSVQKGNTRQCTCQNPCTNSKYGRCVYTYPNKDLRLYPGIERNTDHWNNLYRHRVLVERCINLFKYSFGLAATKTQNLTTIKFDLFLAGCTQLIGVILAKAVNSLKLYKSLRKLVDSIA